MTDKLKRSQKQAYEKQIKSLQALTDRQSSEISYKTIYAGRIYWLNPRWMRKRERRRQKPRRTRRKELCGRERERAGAKRADGHRPQDR